MKSRYLKYLNKISTVDIDLINCDHDISRDLATWPLPAVARREAPRALRADVWLQHLSWSEHCNCAWHGWLKPYEFENCQLPCSNNYLVVIINWQYEEFPLVFSFSRFWMLSALMYSESLIIRERATSVRSEEEQCHHPVAGLVPSHMWLYRPAVAKF